MLKRIMKCGVAGVAMIFSAFAVQAQTANCASTPNMDHPHVLLSNGEAEMLVFLPDSERGYYRSTRFDWSGVIGCATYKGHNYWGEWFPHYDATVNDSITGPVEEFRSEDGGLGYGTAKPGDPFVKIGVGVLRKAGDEPYQFGHKYDIVDLGHWTVKAKKRSVTFEHLLKSPTGVTYKYVKELTLSAHGATITLHHTLKNLGTAAIVTDVYDHDFFMLDHQPTGPGMQITFPFAPEPDQPLDPQAVVDGKSIVYKQELEPHKTVSAYIKGYGSTPASYDIKVEDTNRHFGVEQTSDQPIAKFYLWSIRTTISPEAYIHLDVAPKAAQSWTITYRLFGE
ncbi:hypothetical protein [Silvibacterium acidisoli]|uniref:hypothetical protein n=1 Tax=Acidobacteriaceae bacterium ZG23-2 TaxID=2883246 RepID=UPI00406C18E4